MAVAFGISAAVYVFRLILREVSREQFLIEVRQRQLKTATIDHRIRSCGHSHIVLQAPFERSWLRMTAVALWNCAVWALR